MNVTGKAVRLTIEMERQYGLSPSITGAGLPGYVQVGQDTGNGTEKAVVSADGIITSRLGQVKLTYAAPGGIVSSLIYSKNDPGLVTMIKSVGNVSGKLLMVFERGVRHVCANHVEGDCFEIITYASLLDNRLDSDGTFSIDYIVEIHGVRVERTSLKLSVKRL